MWRLMRFLAGLLLAGFLFIGYMYSVALRDPIVRRANIAMPDWPHGSPPIASCCLRTSMSAPPTCRHPGWRGSSDR